jgi:hypothetical protein
LTALGLSNSYVIVVPSDGHGPGFSECGNAVIAEFLDTPGKKPNADCFNNQGPIKFITGIRINGGISRMINNFISADFIFLTPFIAAVLISVWSFFSSLISFIRKGRESPERKMTTSNILLLATSLIAWGAIAGMVLAIKKTATLNSYILAFGLPWKYNYLFGLLYLLCGLVFTSFLLFTIKINGHPDRTRYLVTMFSQASIIGYFLYWGLI